MLPAVSIPLRAGMDNLRRRSIRGLDLLHEPKMNKWRRFVYLVVDDLCTKAYPLRRIDTSTLFLSRNQGLLDPDPDPEETLLPSPCVSFAPARGPRGLEFLGLFGRAGHTTLLAGVDYSGGPSLCYDVRGGVVRPMASPHDTKFSDPVAAAVGPQALYVMDREPLPGNDRCCFEVLELKEERWEWRRLRPPPFVSDYTRSRIQSYTLVGGSTIWVSAPGAGTHAFDTGTGAWSKAGDWELPFQGRADFFPEIGTWIGFSARDGRLCSSSGLEAMAARAPGLDTLWDGLHLPGKWTPLKSRLMQVGPGGKLCLAILYERVDSEVFDDVTIPQVESCAVFTGLVLKRGEDGLEMTTHKSRLYRLQGGATFAWVF